MNLTSKLILHLDDDRFLQPIPAVQSDTARSVEVALYAGGQPWEIPSGATVSIRYRRADGAGGVYDELEVWRISGNAVTVALKPEVLGVPGITTMQIALRSGDEILSTFSFQIQVQADPSVGVSAPGIPPQSGSAAVELQPLTFTGAVKATYDGKKPVTVNIPTGGSDYTLPIATADTLGGVKPVAKTADMTQPCGVDEFGRLFTDPIESGGNAVPEGCGALDTIIDFTATEGATEIRIPISTEEMAAKLRSATEFRVTIDVPRDESDTETTTAGKVTLGLYVGWNAVILSDMSIIPEPTLTYKNKGRATVAIFRNPGLTTAALPTLLTTTTQAGSTADVVLKSAVVRADSVDASKNHYVYITATQNMAAGTRIVLGVRT